MFIRTITVALIYCKQINLRFPGRLLRHHQHLSQKVDLCDGVSMDFGEWRFNLRASNTEPLLRLNVESRANPALMEQHRDEILGLINRAE